MQLWPLHVCSFSTFTWASMDLSLIGEILPMSSFIIRYSHQSCRRPEIPAIKDSNNVYMISFSMCVYFQWDCYYLLLLIITYHFWNYIFVISIFTCICSYFRNIYCAFSFESFHCNLSTVTVTDFIQVRKYLLRLSTSPSHSKFWKPNLLVIPGGCDAGLLAFCNSLKKGGLMVIGQVSLTLGDHTETANT